MNRSNSGHPATRIGLAVALAGVLCPLVAPSPVVGQTFIPDPTDRVALALQLEKPFLNGALPLDGYTSILEADVLFPLGSTTLQIGVPIAFAGSDFVNGSSAYMGNLRASLLFGEPGALTSHVGLSLPTGTNVSGNDFALLVGGVAWLGELEKWIDETITLSGGFLPGWSLSGGGRVGLQLGGAAFVATDFENLNIDARAGGWVRAPAGSTELRGELATSYLVTSDDGFGQQFRAYLDLQVALVQVSKQPGLFVRLPLDGDGREIHDFSIGLSARF